MTQLLEDMYEDQGYSNLSDHIHMIKYALLSSSLSVNLSQYLEPSFSKIQAKSQLRLLFSPTCTY